MEVLSEVMNGKVKDAVDSIKKVLTKKPEMLEEQIRDKVPVEKEIKTHTFMLRMVLLQRQMFTSKLK